MNEEGCGMRKKIRKIILTFLAVDERWQATSPEVRSLTAYGKSPSQALREFLISEDVLGNVKDKNENLRPDKTS